MSTAAPAVGRQMTSRQPISKEALSVQAVSPLRIPTLASKQPTGLLPVVLVHKKDTSLQIPSGSTSGGLQQPDAAALDAAERSVSGQRVLHNVGWSLGRRGLEALKAFADRGPPSNELKDYWSHFTSLSWLSFHQQARAQNEQNRLVLDHEARHAQHEDYRLAQQVLQQAEMQAKLETVYHHSNMMHDNSDEAPEQHEPSAAHIVTQIAGSSEPLHFDMVRQLPAKDPPMPQQALPQHAKGAEGQEATVVLINKRTDEQSGQPVSEKMAAGDWIEWPLDSQMPMDDDTMASWGGMTAEKERDPIASAIGAGASVGSVQLQSWQTGQNQLPTPSEYGLGNDAQPRIDLALAKQGFGQWLKDVHAQPDMQQKAPST